MRKCRACAKQKPREGYYSEASRTCRECTELRWRARLETVKGKIKCSKCGKEKDTSEFYVTHTSCKNCELIRLRDRKTIVHRRKTALEWRKNNRQKLRDWRMEKKFGLSREAYEELFKKQGGVCAICSSPDPKGKHGTRFTVDHDHKTGDVRGLLCNTCNIALGQFGDDPNLLRKALLYLEIAVI